VGLGQSTVGEIVGDAVKGSVNVPEFQRGFVWRSDQVRDLMDSMYRDYPIGSMLLWDASDREEPKTAKGAPSSSWIVDGQQRTTALCVLFGQKPYWWSRADEWNSLLDHTDVLVNLQSAGDHLEFSLANPVKKKSPSYISVRDILHCPDEEACSELAMSVTSRLGVRPTDPGFARQFGALNGVIGTIWNIRKREIPLVSIKHELEDVAEIFARLNQAGTRVTEADVVLALAAAANESWVRTEFLPFCEDLADRGYDLEPGVFIRTVTGVVRGTARLKDINDKEGFWTAELPKAWKPAQQAITKTIKLLTDRGLLSTQLLPSRNSLIPLFAFEARFGDVVPFDPVFRWFLLANADGRYSGASVTALSQDLASIRDAGDGGAAVKALLGQLRVTDTIQPDRFLTDYSRDRFGRLLVYLLLFDRQALDWVSKVRIGFDKTDSSLNDGFLPEWHHIYPRAFLKRSWKGDKRSEDDMNLLANLTVINEATNKKKLQAKPPEAYIAEYGITDADLARHIVPQTARPLEASRYDDFVMARAEALAAAANNYLARLASD